MIFQFFSDISSKQDLFDQLTKSDLDATVAEFDSLIFGEYNKACPTRRKTITKKIS